MGNGFTVTASDLAFILKQIKIAERHSRSFIDTSATTTEEPTQAPNPNKTTDPEYCASLIPGPLTTPTVPGVFPDQVPDYLTSYGLRTVDGGCNNLVPATLVQPDGTNTNPNNPAPVLKYQTAQADQPFPRLSKPVFRDAEPITPDFAVRSARADELQAEVGHCHRLAASRDQRPDRRSDRDQPGGDCRGRVPGPRPGRHAGHGAVHHPADHPERHRRVCRLVARRRTTRCSSPT